MSDEIFRKKSLDKVKSPENLDDYIKVSNPGVWLLLISVIILLLGVCVWGIFGHVDSTVPVTVQIKNGSAACYISEADISSVKVGQTVEFGNQESVIKTIGEKDGKSYICTLAVEQSLADGFYDGKVVVESYKPLSFILN